MWLEEDAATEATVCLLLLPHQPRRPCLPILALSLMTEGLSLPG